MRYKKLIQSILFGWLLTGLQVLEAQGIPDAPKTTTTTGEDSLKEVQILYAQKLQFKRPNDTTDLTILVGTPANPVRLKQGNTLFMSDSCIINNSQHLFEAFGHVHINDSDTTNIYSDYLKYLTDKKIAYFNGNVKLTDGHGELTTPDMVYDMNTKIGTYTHGGKVINKKSVLTSDEGYYYADLKDVYFKKNVILKDPSYNLKADSLLYSTAFETVRFITKTIIVDSSKRTITTSDGFYDLKQGKAEFGKRPTVEDGKTIIIANQIAFDDSTGISQAKGNAIIRDTSQGTTIIADEIFRNRKTEAILATKKPLMIIKQENDSIYVSADTLFSARLTDLYSRPSSFIKDTIAKSDSSFQEPVPLNIDSLVRKGLAAPEPLVLPEKKIWAESPAPITDAGWHQKIIAEREMIVKADSARQRNLTDERNRIHRKGAPLLQRPLMENSNEPVTDSVFANDFRSGVARLPGDSITVKDSLVIKDSLANRGAAQKNDTAVNHRLAADSLTKITKPLPGDSLRQKDTVKGVNAMALDEKDSTNRYFEAYRHVRIFTDSLQAVSDSMFYSFRDSTFRLFYDPILWSKGSQVTGDTILLMTRNKKADRMKVINNSLLVNKLEKDVYNQVRSVRMDAYFLEGSIDSVRAQGSAECIYFLQDKDSAYTGINQSSSDTMDIYFRDKELHRVVFRHQVKGTIWPIRQKSPSEMRLPNFRWLDERRPKTKYELLE